MIKLKILIILLCISVVHLFGQVDNNGLKFSLGLRPLVNKIAAHNRIEGKNIGRGAHKSKQYPRFIQLQKIASKKDLLSLINHPNPAVRCYSYWALMKYPDINPITLLNNYLHEFETVEVQFGCVVREKTVSQEFLDLTYLYYFNPKTSTYDTSMKVVLDSLSGIIDSNYYKIRDSLEFMKHYLAGQDPARLTDSISIVYVLTGTAMDSVRIVSKVYYNIWEMETFEESYDESGKIWVSYKYEYDKNGNISKEYIYDQGLSSDEDELYVFKYGAKHNLLKTIEYEKEDGKWRVVNIDKKGKEKKVPVGQLRFEGSYGYDNYAAYDSLGRISKSVNMDGQDTVLIKRYFYSIEDTARINWPNGAKNYSTTIIVYDDKGNIAKEIEYHKNQLANIISYRYNNANRLTRKLVENKASNIKTGFIYTYIVRPKH